MSRVDRTLRIRSAIVRDGDALVTYMQGDTVPAKHVKLLEDPVHDLVPLGETVAESTGETVAVAPDPLAASTADLAKWLAESKADGPTTVALATPDGADAPDPARAAAIIAAEQLRAGGDGRTTVITPLQKIVEAAAAPPTGAGGAEGGGSGGTEPPAA